MDQDPETQEMVDIDPKKLKQLLKVMRENGVTYLKTESLELRVTLEASQEFSADSVKRNLTPQEKFAQPYFKL